MRSSRVGTSASCAMTAGRPSHVHKNTVASGMGTIGLFQRWTGSSTRTSFLVHIERAVIDDQPFVVIHPLHQPFMTDTQLLRRLFDRQRTIQNRRGRLQLDRYRGSFSIWKSSNFPPTPLQRPVPNTFTVLNRHSCWVSRNIFQH